MSPFILLIPITYLFMMAFIMKTENLISSVIFKFLPFVLGVLTSLYMVNQAYPNAFK